MKTWRTRIAIFALALAVRLIALQLWPTNADTLRYDQSEYLSLGYHLAHFHTLSFGEPHKFAADGHFPGQGPVIPTAARAPLYPAFIAVLWSGPPFSAIRTAQAIMGALSAVLVFEIGAATFGPPVGILAGLAYCLAPLTVQSVAMIISEPLFILLFLTGLRSWISKRYALAGFVFGLAILTRAVLLPFLVVLLVIYAIRRVRGLPAIALVAAAVVLPWTIRNIVVLRQPILVNTEGWGSTLLEGTILVPYGSGSPWSIYSSHPAVRAAIDSTPDESQAEKEMLSSAVARIESNPLQWVIIRARQYPRLYLDTGTSIMQLTRDPRLNLPIKIIFAAGNALLLIAAAIGGWKVRQQAEALPILSVIVYFAVIVFPVWAETRYSLPMTPELLILASVAFCDIMEVSR